MNTLFVFPSCLSSRHWHNFLQMQSGYLGGGAALHIFWVWGCAIGKGIDFLDIGIENGEFSQFWYKEWYQFGDFGMKWKVRIHFLDFFKKLV